MTRFDPKSLLAHVKEYADLVDVFPSQTTVLDVECAKASVIAFGPESAAGVVATDQFVKGRVTAARTASSTLHPSFLTRSSNCQPQAAMAHLLCSRWG